MTTNKIVSWLALACAGLGTAVLGGGCVSSRPSRNGVFNENQYVRKDFLTRAGSGGAADPGWIMQVTVTSTSTPNPLAFVGGAGLFAGAQSQGSNLVRFGITQDKLQLIDMRELSSDATSASQGLRTPAIINAWPATNVDLKYRVNLDGETTNFFEENQENDWQVRQWVKLNFAKNDFSDLQPFFGDLNPVILKCTNTVDASATMIPNSLLVDTPNGYMEFGVTITLPISYSDTDAATCYQAFGGPLADTFLRIGKPTVTLNLLYSFVRPDNYPNKQLDGSYVAMPVYEKDPIRRKYGFFDFIQPYRDESTGLQGATENVIRYDPNKDITYYFAPGVPPDYQNLFTRAGGVVDATNAVLGKGGAKGKLRVLNFDDAEQLNDHKSQAPKHFGDVRYNWIVYHSDYDNGSGLLGVAQFNPDPRTGQMLSASINVFEGQFRDTMLQRLDFFLQTVGAEYLKSDGSFDDSKYPPSCMDGDVVPLVDTDIAAIVNTQSTVYGKMQAYLQKPISQYGNLGPANFLPTHDSDFYDAYFAVLPYQVYADPGANPFVVPEGSVFGTAAAENWQGLQKVAAFNDLASQIDHGAKPWDVADKNGVVAAINFNHTLSNLSQGAVDYYQITRARQPLLSHADDLSLFSYLDIYQKNGRHCVGNKWETRDQYVNRLLVSLNSAVALHEFGHALGLRHNFMGSVDQRNYAKDTKGNTTLLSSSIMDYNQALVEAFYDPSTSGGWPPYDAATLGFIYGNNLSKDKTGPNPGTGASTTVSGQTSATAPWNDPLGFDSNGKERPFLYCSDEHLAYTPLCRQYDMGATPSEIISNEIQQREWNYLWTNFRLYHKYFDLGAYPTTVARQFAEYRRFLSLWSFDWSQGELTNSLRLVGITAPAGQNTGEYYDQLTNKFNIDISMANQIAAAYHRAIIEQSSGERPFITVFDPFYGDTTQQGIQLDKLISLQSFSTLWPAISNFDPSQAGAFMLSNAAGGDASYHGVANGVLLDFLGASFATYEYAQIGPISAFAEETHSSQWPGDSSVQFWIGGLTFERERDFLDYLHSLADKFGFQNCDENGLNCDPCTSIDHCTWDPRTLAVKPSQITQSDRFNRFQGPDGRTYIWMYLSSRNQWVLADKDRNVALYTLMLNWSTDVVNNEDDGYDGAQDDELRVRYMIDSFEYYNNFQPATP